MCVGQNQGVGGVGKGWGGGWGGGDLGGMKSLQKSNVQHIYSSLGRVGRRPQVCPHIRPTPVFVKN